jgi:cation:H+ antiporter
LLILEFLGLLLVITGAAWLLSIGAEKMAEKYGANFAGSILLALVTTLPEYMFVFWAAVKGHYAMALGSAVGACTLLVTLGYGSVILFATSRLSRQPVKVVTLSHNTRIDALYLMLTALVALGLAWEGGGLDLKDGIILAVMFAAYVVEHYRLAKGHASMNGNDLTKGDMRRAILALVLGGIIIVVCAEKFVESMVHLSEWIGISPVAIAIIVSPIASEMPEKVTAYLTVMRSGKLAEISVCNFIGSKVNHNSLLLAVMPFVAATHGDSNVTGIISVPFIVMTVLTLFAGLSLARRRLEHWQGWLFLGLYLSLIAAAYAVR